jgi:hypothetical protein
MQGSGAGSYYISGKIVTMVKKKKKNLSDFYA